MTYFIGSFSKSLRRAEVTLQSRLK